jgi:hypothetical protein
MPRRVLLRALEVILALLATVIYGFSQTPPKIIQEAKDTTCSNIVALAGNVNIKCSSLTPAQKRLIESIPALLNKIISNQLDPDIVMAKLDEIQKGVEEVKKHVNPNATQVTYSLEGMRRTISPGRIMGSDEAVNDYRVLRGLMDNKEWAKLIESCESQMQKRPEWLTPYAFAGIAYANLGQKDKAVQLLEQASQGMADNPDYKPLQDFVTKLLNALRSR